MKISHWLKAVALWTSATCGTCALAQFEATLGTPEHITTPTVRIIFPQEGAAFLLGDQIQIDADVDGFSNHVTGVTFYAGGATLGVSSNGVYGSDTYSLTVSNLMVGDFELWAVATDSGGIMATSAIVDISVVTNLPPKVHIVDPGNGAVILGPTNVEVCAAAFDPDGTVASVEFFSGSNSIGTVTAPPVLTVTNRWGIFPIREPFCLTWSNAPAGSQVLTAVATDNGGAMATSAPVSITIVTDLPPRVHIESPANGASYRQPANIMISADASDPDGTVASVQFFAGATSLGTVTVPTVVSNRWFVDRDYTLTWSNAPVGTNELTAVATDNAGMSSTSAPVKVTVVAPPPPKVTIENLRNDSTIFGAPRSIDVCALESNFTNPVVKVQFYAGTNGIGATSSSPYSCITWSNVPPGTYTLKAIATDSASITATSPPVNITVVTNRPPSWWWWKE